MLPVWSPDGSRLYFTSSRKGSLNLFRRSLAGLPTDELLFESSDLKLPNAVSRDEQVLLFTQSGSGGLWFGRDIWALPLTGERKPFAVVRTRYEEEEAAFSPDGKWISYHSNDLGGWQVYVESFPVAGQRVRISTTSGFGASWSQDGRSIFYRTSDDEIMAVEVAVSPGQLRPSAPRELFASERLADGSRRLDIDHRGSRFLLTTRLRAADVPRLTVVTSWPANAAVSWTRVR